jgi:hypothetical protein
MSCNIKTEPKDKPTSERTYSFYQAPNTIMQAILQLFQLIGESTPLMVCAALLEVFSVVIMNQKTTHLIQTFGGNEPPDMWFGIEAKRLYSYLAGIGADGRAAYLDMVSWDVMPCMPAYTLLLGPLLYRECETAGLPTKLSLIFVVAMICDAVETIGCGFVTKTFPKPMKPEYVDLISNANAMKWVTLMMGSMLLGLLFLKNLLFPPKQSSLLEAAESHTKKES